MHAFYWNARRKPGGHFSAIMTCGVSPAYVRIIDMAFTYNQLTFENDHEW